jgi:hypothetical protein
MIPASAFGDRHPAKLSRDELWTWCHSAALEWPCVRRGIHPRQPLCRTAAVPVRREPRRGHVERSPGDRCYDERWYCVERASLSQVTVACRKCGPASFRVWDTHVEQLLEALNLECDSPRPFCSNVTQS